MSFDVGAVERVIGVHFRDPELLQRAFVDRSAVPEGYISWSNTRLAYLGDGLLSAFVRDFFYTRDDLTIISIQQHESRLLSNQTLNAYVRLHDWEAFLVTGDYDGFGEAGVERAAKRAATLFEAVIAALFLDQGYAATSEYLQRTFLADVGTLMQLAPPSTALQLLHEYLATRYGRQPVRTKRVLRHGDPNQRYFYEYRFERLSGSGIAATKGIAKEKAARSLLDQLLNADTLHVEGRP